MTREERARALINKHLLHAAMAGAADADERWVETAHVAAMLAFADAEIDRALAEAEARHNEHLTAVATAIRDLKGQP